MFIRPGAFRSEASQGRPIVGADAPHPRSAAREGGTSVSENGDNPSDCAWMDISNENDQAYRTISTGKLQALPLFHTRPINVVVFHGSQGILVSRWVSRLDAFSGYPVRI